MRILVCVLTVACLVSQTSCSKKGDGNQPTGSTGPTTETLLSSGNTDDWTIESGVYHLWSPDDNSAQIVHTQRALTFSESIFTNGWHVPAEGGIHISTGCAYRVYVTSGKIASDDIDLSAWDSARIYFSVRTDRRGGQSNGNATVSLAIRSNVPGLPDIPLATHTTSMADKSYDLSLAGVATYQEASVVVTFSSSADCNGENTGYTNSLVLYGLNVRATRD